MLSHVITHCNHTYFACAPADATGKAFRVIVARERVRARMVPGHTLPHKPAPTAHKSQTIPHVTPAA